MKKIAIAVAAALTAIAPAAFAQTYYQPSYNNSSDSREYRASDRDSYRDGRYRGQSARVIESRPLYAAGDARQECWNPRAGHYEELRNSGSSQGSALNKGTALGALVGGVAGHQVGSGRGNDAATVGGAILGGILGNRMNQRGNEDEQNDLDKSKCRLIAGNDVPVQGYEVRYEYRGQEYVTRTRENPGTELRLGREIGEDGRPFG